MLLTISGSLRQASVNTRLCAEAARVYGGPSEMGDLHLPLYDGDLEDAKGVPESVTALADQIKAAEAIVVSTPEYNQSISGVLKNALDWVSRVKGGVWRDKPVAVMSAAAGRAGGARAQFALRLAMTPFGPRMLTGPELMLADASNQFNDEGRLTDERYAKALEALMQRLHDEVARG